MKNLIAKVYPDLTGSVTRKREFTVPATVKSCRWNPIEAARREAVKVLGPLGVAELLGIRLGESEAPPLPCQVLQKSALPSEPPRLGLTDRGRKAIRRAMCAFEKHVPKEQTCFGTLTLSPGAIEAILLQEKLGVEGVYQTILSDFMSRLRKVLRRRGLPGDVTWVTEIHPSRSRNQGVAIPHVHFVCQTALKKFKWLVTPDEVKSLWRRTIYAHVDVNEESFVDSRVEIKCVKKSVARYVAKYMSKRASKTLNPLVPLDYSLVPVRWYAIANAIHKLVRKLTVVATGDAAAAILDFIKMHDNPIVWRHGDIEITGDSGRPVWLATWFKLSEPIDPSLTAL